MHYRTPPSLSRTSVMIVTTFSLFTSVCIGVPAAGSSVPLLSASCAPGRNHTVQPGDTCQIIAENYNVSTGDIIALNCLNPEGTDLLANTTISLPGCCTTYTVESHDDCHKVASANDLTLPQFYSFNPTINKNCSNLDTGLNVCLTAPLGTPFNTAPCQANSSTSDNSTGVFQRSLAPRIRQNKG